MSNRRPTISLCMMVKNEETLLPQCLESIKNWVNEIIVVDTGSTDRTVEIANAYGAAVFSHPWEDDFSKHRNQSLSYATGDWILILDADEKLEEGHGEKLREVIAACEEDVTQIYFRVKDMVDGKVSMISNSLRLYRNHVGAYYKGIVHNLIVVPEGKSVRSDISLLHYGYGLSEEKAEKKFHRTCSLLKKQLIANPDDLYAIYNMATTLINVNPEESITYGFRLLSLLKQKGDVPVFHINIFYVLAVAFIKKKEFDRAIDMCLEAVRIFPKYVDAYWILCELYFDRLAYAETIHYGNEFLAYLDYYKNNREELTDLFVYSYNKQNKVRLRLGLSYILIDDWDSAKLHLRKYLKEQDPAADAQLVIISHLRKHHERYEAIEKRIEKLLTDAAGEDGIGIENTNEAMKQKDMTPVSQKAHPTVSLCMIVKDEEELIPRCLQSVRPYVDEMVIVDTGSTDRTVEIAEDFGATVYHHPWEDDFSRHRNQSIAYATGDWFLILDADEELVCETESKTIMNMAIRDITVDSISFRIESLYAGGKKSLHVQERLFRNDRGIHYEGRIHNRIAGVKRTKFYPIKILHHGYNVPPEKGKKKHERRLSILEKEIRDDPLNPSYHHYLAASYLSAPDYEKAVEAALHALELAEKNGEAANPIYAWTYYIAANSLFQLGRIEDSKQISGMGLERFPKDLDLHFMRCQICFDQNDRLSLEQYARTYLKFHNEITSNPASKGMAHCVTFDQAWRVRYYLAMNHDRAGDSTAYKRELDIAFELAPKRADVFHAKGRYHMQNGDYDKAREDFSHAFSENPRDMDIIFSNVELCIRLGDEVREIDWWKELLIRFPDKRNDMIKEAEKAANQGRLVDARKLLTAINATAPPIKQSRHIKEFTPNIL